MAASDHLSPGQFYHGTTHYFRPGDVITPGGHDTRHYAESSQEHVYMTTDKKLAATYAGMRDDPQPEHSRADRYSVYKVAPTGDYEPDPQHTGGTQGYDKEPNYRSASPLRVVNRVNYTHSQIRDAVFMDV